MKKSVWIFLLAVFLPGAVLGWLALRGVEEQQIVFERRTAELYQKETEALASEVRDAVEAQRRDFGDALHRLLARNDPRKLADDFTTSLADVWPRKVIGFALSKDGVMLSPTTKVAASNQDWTNFIWNDGPWLCNAQVARVYVPRQDNSNKYTGNSLAYQPSGNITRYANQRAGRESDNNNIDKDNAGKEITVAKAELALQQGVLDNGGRAKESAGQSPENYGRPPNAPTRPVAQDEGAVLEALKQQPQAAPAPVPVPALIPAGPKPALPASPGEQPTEAKTLTADSITAALKPELKPESVMLDHEYGSQRKLDMAATVTAEKPANRTGATREKDAMPSPPLDPAAISPLFASNPRPAAAAAPVMTGGTGLATTTSEAVPIQEALAKSLREPNKPTGDTWKPSINLGRAFKRGWSFDVNGGPRLEEDRKAGAPDVADEFSVYRQRRSTMNSDLFAAWDGWALEDYYAEHVVNWTEAKEHALGVKPYYFDTRSVSSLDSTPTIAGLSGSGPAPIASVEVKKKAETDLSMGEPAAINGTSTLGDAAIKLRGTVDFAKPQAPITLGGGGGARGGPMGGASGNATEAAPKTPLAAAPDGERKDTLAEMDTADGDRRRQLKNTDPDAQAAETGAGVIQGKILSSAHSMAVDKGKKGQLDREKELADQAGTPLVTNNVLDPNAAHVVRRVPSPEGDITLRVGPKKIAGGKGAIIQSKEAPTEMAPVPAAPMPTVSVPATRMPVAPMPAVSVPATPVPPAAPVTAPAPMDAPTAVEGKSSSRGAGFEVASATGVQKGLDDSLIIGRKMEERAKSNVSQLAKERAEGLEEKREPERIEARQQVEKFAVPQPPEKSAVPQTALPSNQPIEQQAQQGWAGADGVANGAVARNVAPQQVLNAPSQAVSSLVPDTAAFNTITGMSDEGMVARFVQDKLEIIFWVRPPEDRNLVFGCLVEAEALKDILTGLVAQHNTNGDGSKPAYVLALLDDKAKPVAVQPASSGMREWKRPFVASEVGEALPHWEATLYLASPGALAESASGFRRTLSFTVVAALAIILIGAWLVVADIRRQLALAQQKTDFVSNVSHELKTPLTSIRMFAELMHDRPPPVEKQGQYLRIITVEAERLTRLINNVLDFAKLERRQKRFEKRPLEMHSVIARVWDCHEMHLRDAGFTTRWQAAPPPYPVIGDEDALAQVLVNLLSNAEKYSPERKEVELHTWVEDGWLHLSVLDRGMGVPSGEERKIFESFYRAHDSLSSGIQGSGLGLTLAQRLAEEHGGRIEYSQREGGGSRFTLLLPLVETPPREA